MMVDEVGVFGRDCRVNNLLRNNELHKFRYINVAYRT